MTPDSTMLIVGVNALVFVPTEGGQIADVRLLRRYQHIGSLAVKERHSRRGDQRAQVAGLRRPEQQVDLQIVQVGDCGR